jgi:hypothetical protein
VRLFLLGDAAGCAKGNQKVPQGYYNIDWVQWADHTLVF